MISLLLPAFVGAALFVTAGGKLSLRPWRASAGRHWTERARILWPARMTINHLLLISTLSAVLASILFSEQFAFHPGFVACVFAGGYLGIYPFSKEVDPQIRWGPWLKLHAIRQFPVLSLVGILAWLVLDTPAHLSGRDWLHVGAGLSGILFIQSGVWMPWLLSTGRRDPQLPRLHAIAGVASSEARFPTPHVWLSDLPFANAFAYPLRNEIMFTRRSMEILSDAEVAAIFRHELAHLAEPRILKLARFMGISCWFPFAFFEHLHLYLGDGTFPVLFMVGFLGSRMTRILQLKLEKRADAMAIISENESSAVYASALEKLYMANHIPAVIPTKNLTHPCLYDRILAVGVQPEYPRPLPPKTTSWITWGALLLPLALILIKGGLSHR